MARHACHGIFIRLVGGLTREDVYLRIVSHHALIHAVEGQLLSVRTPESSFIDAKLIAVDRLAVDDFARSVVGELILLIVGIPHIELPVLGISNGTRGFVPVVISCALDVLHHRGLLLLEVVKNLDGVVAE